MNLKWTWAGLGPSEVPEGMYINEFKMDLDGSLQKINPGIAKNSLHKIALSLTKQSNFRLRAKFSKNGFSKNFI